MKKLLFFSTILVFLASCKKDAQQVTPTPGIGNGGGISKSPGAGFGQSTLPFNGTPWQLPDSLQLIDTAHTYSWCYGVRTPAAFVPYKNFHGVPGGIIQVCFTVKNPTGIPITINFPDRWVMSCSDYRSQGVLFLYPGSILIATHSQQTIVLSGFCINKSRHLPDVVDEDGKTITFAFGPTNLPSAFDELTTIVKAKNLTYSDILNADGTPNITKASNASMIQEAVWEITDDGGLTPNTKQAVKDLVL